MNSSKKVSCFSKRAEERSKMIPWCTANRIWSYSGLFWISYSGHAIPIWCPHEQLSSLRRITYSSSLKRRSEASLSRPFNEIPYIRTIAEGCRFELRKAKCTKSYSSTKTRVKHGFTKCKFLEAREWDRVRHPPFSKSSKVVVLVCVHLHSRY